MAEGRLCGAFIAITVLALATGVSSQANDCVNPVEQCDEDTDYFPVKTSSDFGADDVEWSFENLAVRVEVKNAFGPAQNFRLIRCGCEDVAGPTPADTVDISVPVSKVFVSESPMAYFFEELDALDSVTAVSFGAFIYSAEIQRRIEAGEIISLDMAGTSELDTNPDAFPDETLRPSLALVGAFDGPLTSVPTFPILEFQSNTPLARAEWVKLVGYLIGKEELAGEVFEAVRDRYVLTQRLANSVRRQPSVVVNQLFGDFFWTHLAEDSYPFKLLTDANAAYRIVDIINATVADSAAVYSSADYWLNLGFPKETTFEDFLANDYFTDEDREIMRNFESVRCGRVWSYGGRARDNGGGFPAVDYFESGIVRPDLVLADLVKILHPNLPVDTELFYFFNVEDEPRTCPVPDLVAGPPSAEEAFVTSRIQFSEGRFDVEDITADVIRPAILSATDSSSETVSSAFDQTDDVLSSAILETTFVVDNSDDAIEEKMNLIESNLAEQVSAALVAAGKEGRAAQVDLLEGETERGSTEGGLSTGQIVGIVAGILVGLLALVAVVVAVRSRSAGSADPNVLQVDPEAEGELDEPAEVTKSGV